MRAPALAPRLRIVVETANRKLKTCLGATQTSEDNGKSETKDQTLYQRFQGKRMLITECENNIGPALVEAA